jgi:sulfoxide reductase heme-binding subunit YedZ
VKPAAVAVLLLPLVKIGWDAFTGGLGANPIEAVLNRLGFWTMVVLALALVPTPAHDLLGLSWPQRLRRIVGVTAFGYGLVHFLFYVGVDKFFDVRTIGQDLTKRPFIMVGFAALLCLLPLAVTSTDGWVRRLGHRRWKLLHRLVYVAAALAVVHFLWRVKADVRRPLAFAAVFGVLLLARVPGWVRSARRAGEGARPATRGLTGPAHPDNDSQH